jgi:hypothetical protein
MTSHPAVASASNKQLSALTTTRIEPMRGGIDLPEM